ncbi:pantetheine-phosphate adenylyltransferase [Hydrogenophaga sp. BPS33]|uniref:pantetheine-phosphate adenylyltransferase n=1 Tax=Hydrogenophaga sp. BPS33 TaxID=2651974 RepID=UPI00131F8725|nr:pantetheine-phosphate adenylyltransferase [Hydrogenophaga sp. BPS33]QHE87078.1 pantetheine-phosphate adenylyltransferase [Hydrogenophaga sp. BPS33]
MSSALASTGGNGRVAVYSGTFDPITLGHEDVARRASQLFEDVIIAVAIAHHKKTRFTLQERLDMAAVAASRMPGRVRVLPFDGLIMDFCRQHNATAVVRGIRNLTDFDYEAQMAAMNRKLNPAVETVFLLPQADLQCISSTLVREISQLGGDISQMVSASVAQNLKPRPVQA